MFVRFALLFCLCSSTGYSQLIIKGVVADSTSKIPLPFAHLTLDDRKTGVITDIDGKFSLPIPSTYQGDVLVSFVGYNTRTLAPREWKQNETIYLAPQVTNLKEVVIRASENPAHRIMRQVVLHREEHKPYNYPHFSYTAYTKVIGTGRGEGINKDSLIAARQATGKPVTSADSAKWKVKEFFERRHFFMSESVTEKFFEQPKRHHERLLAHKVSGFQSPLFTSLPNDFQPLGFYDETVSLMGKDFLNPISKASERKYDFTLVDTLFTPHDTIYLITFEPLPQTTFNGLKGTLSVSTDGFALKNIIAKSVDENEKVSLNFQQNYEKIDGRWFPTQMITEVELPTITVGRMRLILEAKSYLKDIRFAPPDPKMFKGAETDLSSSKGDVLLVQHRLGGLNARDSSTYNMYDSLREKVKAFRFLDNVSAGFLSNAWPLGKVDLMLRDILLINRYEGTRVTASFVTNPALSKWVALGSYAGYGFKDKAWKYGGFLQFNLHEARRWYVQAGYDDNLTEAGVQNFLIERNTISSRAFRNWLGTNFDAHQTWYAKSGIDLFNNWNFVAGVQYAEMQPKYQYALQHRGDLLSSFRLAEVTSALTYIGDQKRLSYQGRSTLTGFAFPVFSLQISQAMPGAFGSQDFQYTRYNLIWLDQWKHRRLGKTRTFVVAGWLDGIAPWNRLFYGRGSNETAYQTDGYFQTMGFNEFITDHFANLFITQNFGPIFYNAQWSRPELTLSQAIGYGRFTQSQAHNTVTPLQDFEKGFFESGIGLNNLVRFNYLDVAYFGLGGGIYYRYGPYQLNKTSDNIALRFNASFSF